MRTIKQYLADNPTWFDGTPTTDKKIRVAIKNKTLGARKVKGQFLIFDGQDVDQKSQGWASRRSDMTANLSQAATALDIKIKKERLAQEEIKTRKMRGEFYGIDDVLDLFSEVKKRMCADCAAKIDEIMNNVKP
jgi:hypothetical protein